MAPEIAANSAVRYESSSAMLPVVSNTSAASMTVWAPRCENSVWDASQSDIVKPGSPAIPACAAR